MKAMLTNSRHAPRKMRLVADMVKGKPIQRALDILSIAPKRAAYPIEKLILSAVANAKASGIQTAGLVVKECRVDGGVTLKRFMPGARGSAFSIKKRTSHVLVTLGEPTKNAKSEKSAKRAALQVLKLKKA